MNIKINIDYSWLIMLTIVFYILKAMGYISWNWIWIFSPLIVAAVLTVIVIIIYKKIIK